MLCLRNCSLSGMAPILCQRISSCCWPPRVLVCCVYSTQGPSQPWCPHANGFVRCSGCRHATMSVRLSFLFEQAWWLAGTLPVSWGNDSLVLPHLEEVDVRDNVDINGIYSVSHSLFPSVQAQGSKLKVQHSPARMRACARSRGSLHAERVGTCSAGTLPAWGSSQGLTSMKYLLLSNTSLKGPLPETFNRSGSDAAYRAALAQPGPLTNA